MRSQQERKLRARFAGQNRIELPRLSAKCADFRMEQDRDLITFGIAVNGFEATNYQVACCFYHVVPEAHVEGLFELVNLFGQSSKVTAINPRDHKDAWKHEVIMSGFEYPHLCIKLVKLHLSSPPPRTLQHRLF